MNCTRGLATPNRHTKLWLFADSGGYCQNPACNRNMFLTLGDKDIHIAEMAHIIGVGETGPRTRKKLTAAEKGNFENLILLCPTCHTQIDKAESQFPEDLVRGWKKAHSEKINTLFQIKPYVDRRQARKAVAPILQENKTIFELYGPMNEERYNPETGVPKQWLGKVQQHILPNNRKLFRLVETNYHLLHPNELRTVEIFKQHVLDLEARHINGDGINATQFPEAFTFIFNE